FECVVNDERRRNFPRLPSAGTPSLELSSTASTPCMTRVAQSLLTPAAARRYTPTAHQNKRKKMMHTISFFGGRDRSLRWSDTVTASKARYCIEMRSLLHSC